MTEKEYTKLVESYGFVFFGDPERVDQRCSSCGVCQGQIHCDHCDFFGDKKKVNERCEECK